MGRLGAEPGGCSEKIVEKVRQETCNQSDIFREAQLHHSRNVQMSREGLAMKDAIGKYSFKSGDPRIENLPPRPGRSTPSRFFAAPLEG